MILCCITAPGARGIAPGIEGDPPDLHPESPSVHLFITKFIEARWIITISSGNRRDHYNHFQEFITILRLSLAPAQCHLVVVCGGLLDEGS